MVFIFSINLLSHILTQFKNKNKKHFFQSIEMHTLRCIPTEGMWLHLKCNDMKTTNNW